MTVKDGGAAFPREDYQADVDKGQRGMSLRQWYAGQALAGLCANPGGPYQHSELSGWSMVSCEHHHIVDEAVRLADAMIKALG